MHSRSIYILEAGRVDHKCGLNLFMDKMPQNKSDNRVKVVETFIAEIKTKSPKLRKHSRGFRENCRYPYKSLRFNALTKSGFTFTWKRRWKQLHTSTKTCAHIWQIYCQSSIHPIGIIKSPHIFRSQNKQKNVESRRSSNDKKIDHQATMNPFKEKLKRWMGTHQSNPLLSASFPRYVTISTSG